MWWDPNNCLNDSLLDCAVPSWKGDGICDDQNNFEDCEYDGGDCCGTNINKHFCVECECICKFENT